jgi:hypothetical protein
MLTYLTNSEVKDVLTMTATRKIVKQGFLDYFLSRSMSMDYRISEEEDES